jgi:adenine/guanine phosphoribosyltransferase-like PRPP-binding protein
MIPLRRGEKLPYNSDELYSVAFMDYQLKRKSLEVAKDADLRGKKVLIVDELIETGAQIKAVMALLEKFGCTVIGIATIYSIPSVRTLRWKEEGLLTAITEEL